MKRSSFNVLFFLKKTKLLKNGEAPCVYGSMKKKKICDFFAAIAKLIYI